MSRLPVVKEEYEDLPTSLDEWDPLTENIVTNSSPQLSTTTTESVSNQHSLTVTTPNDSITIPITTSRASDNDKTRSSMVSVHESPKDGEGLVKHAQRSNRPFITNSNNQVTSNSFQAQQKDTEFPFNLELHFKQTQEQLKEFTEKLVQNANQTLQKKYDELQLDYFEFKTNANVKLAKLDTLQMENAKLRDEVNQLKDQRSLISQVKQEYFDDEVDKDGTSTNTNRVTVKTEPNDEDVKVEIKEEYDEDNDDDCGYDRYLVKGELDSDDEQEDDDGRYEVIQPYGDNDQLLGNLSQGSQNVHNVNESMDEGVANLPSTEQVLNTLNEPNERTVTQSGDLFSASTSTGQDSIRTDLTGRKRNLSSRSSAPTAKRAKKNYVCKQCDASFVGLSNLLNHERIHLGIKPFSCSWPHCPGYASEKYGNVILHIVGLHFKLPRTIKERKEQAIADERNPNQFVRVDDQLVNRRL